MALPRLRSVPNEDEVIPRVYDNIEFAKAAELAGAFRDRITRLQREKLRIDLERVFARRAVRQDSTADCDLWNRLLALRKELSSVATSTPPAMPASPSEAILLGLAVLGGRPIPTAPDHAAQLAELDRQIAVLHVALVEQEQIVEGIVGELTLKYATQLKPKWDALQLEMYRAAQELARTARRFREFRSAIVSAGIRSRSDILRSPNVRTPLLIGDESDWNSEIGGWRRLLEQWGLLP